MKQIPNYDKCFLCYNVDQIWWYLNASIIIPFVSNWKHCRSQQIVMSLYRWYSSSTGTMKIESKVEVKAEPESIRWVGNRPSWRPRLHSSTTSLKITTNTPNCFFIERNHDEVYGPLQRRRWSPFFALFTSSAEDLKVFICGGTSWFDRRRFLHVEAKITVAGTLTVHRFN